MAAALGQQLQLGADAVGRGDQDRIAKAGLRQVKQAAEAADLTQCPGARGAPRQGTDRRHQGLARVDVHPRLAIPGHLGRLQGLLCHEVGLG